MPKSCCLVRALTTFEHTWHTWCDRITNCNLSVTTNILWVKYLVLTLSWGGGSVCPRTHVKCLKGLFTYSMIGLQNIKLKPHATLPLGTPNFYQTCDRKPLSSQLPLLDREQAGLSVGELTQVGVSRRVVDISGLYNRQDFFWRTDTDFLRFWRYV